MFLSYPRYVRSETTYNDPVKDGDLIKWQEVNTYWSTVEEFNKYVNDQQSIIQSEQVHDSQTVISKANDEINWAKKVL